MKQTMFIMKKNASKEVEKALKKWENKKQKDFRPPFLKEDAWMGCCDYWETEGHEKMSKINTENRKHLTFMHASGAMPFEQRWSANMEETGEILSELELFDIVYTKKHAELMKIKLAKENECYGRTACSSAKEGETFYVPTPYSLRTSWTSRGSCMD
ncbi:hypothetical protein POM88_010041 [Heracleum sosnowskyi]|uniref:Uncharacterized protein n=1 Tax=Heracleum sosnowskyi TaxID=360622 RepID=A0AAD8JA84_9APIA|nr:hypothetical protein POM88_010041 [Heracleum sosnowskyi]